MGAEELPKEMVNERNQRAAVLCRRPCNALFNFLLITVLFVSTALAQEISRDAGHVAVLEYPDPNTSSYNALFPDGSLNFTARESISQQFYGTHGDNYDFLYLFTNFDFALREKEALGEHWGVKNVVQGIGIPLNDATSLFGSKGRLQGLIDLGNIERVVSDPTSSLFGRTLAVIAHETAHQWGSYLSYIDETGARSRALIGQDNAHWSFLLDSNASVMYGAAWQDNKNGTFTAIDIMERYSPLDLYLMGFLSPSEVPPFILIQNPAIDPTQLPQKDITIAGIPITITIDQVIASEGPRVPGASSSQKEFRGAFVLLTANGVEPTPQQIQAVDTIRQQWAKEFFLMTKGKAIIETTLVEIPQGPFAIPPQVMKGLTWLSTHEDPEGSWADTPFTPLRETTEAITTLLPYPRFIANVSTGLSWLSRAPPSNVDFLSRRLATLSLAHQPDLPGIGDLFQRKNAENGFGLSADYLSAPLDTALALLALKEGSRLQDLLLVVQRLQSLQNPDGGWGSHLTGPSQIAPTALSLYALYLFKGVASVDDSISRGMGWLLSQQSPDGHIGRSDETALSLLSIVQKDHNRYHSQIESAAQALLGEQNIDFSWNQSAYDTALAVRAISQAFYSNLYLTSTDLTISSNQPFEGEKVLVTARVHNGGSYPANSVLVRFFDGDPFQGGIQIGVDQTISTILPQGSITVQALWDTTGISGDHLIVAQVDPLDTIPEPDETDNQAVVNASIRPRPPLAELSVNSAEIAVYPDPIFLLPMDVTIHAIIRNIGSVDANAVEVAFYDGSQDPQHLLGSTIVQLVSAGGFALASSIITISTPGDHNIIIVVDPQSLVPELDKTNNIASKTLSILPTIDLEIRSEEIVVSSSIINIGEHLTVSARVRNKGTQPATDVDVAFYAASAAGQELMGMTHIPLIYGGASWYANLDWLSEIPGSPVTISIVADPFGKIPLDVNRDNNTGFTEVTILPSTLANLRTKPNWITVSSEPGLQGAPLTVSAIVENNGFDTANNIVISLYTAHPDAGGTLIDTQTILSLVPGEQTTVTFQWGAVPVHGDIPLTVVIDPQNQIAEFTREDNQAVKLLYVLSLPDLALSDADISFIPSFPSPRVNFTVTAAIHNLGDQGVGSFSVQILYDGQLVAENTSVSIYGTGLTTQTFIIQSDQEGTHTITIVLDPENAVAELSKANNTATKSLQIQSADIYVTEPYFSPNGDRIKDTTTIVYRATDVTAVTLRSSDGDIVRTFTAVTGPVFWDGLTDDGIVAPNDSYDVQLLMATGIPLLSTTKIVLDTNRSPLAEAAGTPYLRKRSILCGMYFDENLWSPDGSKLLFTPSNLPNKGLYSSNPDGSDIENLTPGFTSWISDFNMSKDGRTIAFEYDLGWIWMKKPDEKVFAKIVSGYLPRLSPDSSKLLYSQWDSPYYHGTLRIKSVDGSSDVYIAPVVDRPAYSWSSDGEKIAYISPSGDLGDLWIANSDGTNLISLPGFINAYAWSPSGDKIAALTERYQNYQWVYFLDIFSNKGELLKEIQIPGRYSDFIQWFPDGKRVAFSPDGSWREMDFIDIYDFQKDSVTRIYDNPTLDPSKSIGYPEVSPDGMYIYYSNLSLYQLYALKVKTGEKIFIGSTGRLYDYPYYWYPYGGGAYVNNNELPVFSSPTGEFYYYSSAESCNNWNGRIIINSLENLTAELHASRPPGSAGLILTGTASDKNFESYSLEYALTSSPTTWTAIGLPSSLQVIDDVLGNWFPPGPGTYLVRLIVQDKAGNVRTAVAKVPWAEEPAITNVIVSPQYISPNGDGIQDSSVLSFLVLRPGTLEFDIYSPEGKLVNAIAHTTVGSGSQDSVVWDGRDFNGIIVPDGRYSIKVSGLVFYVTVDTIPPNVALFFGVPAQATVGLGNRYVATTFNVGTSLSGGLEKPVIYSYESLKAALALQVQDISLQKWTLIETTTGDTLTTGTTEISEGNFISKDAPAIVSNHQRFHLSARDLAGNFSEVFLPFSDITDGIFIVSVDVLCPSKEWAPPVISWDMVDKPENQDLKGGSIHQLQIGVTHADQILNYDVQYRYTTDTTWISSPSSPMGPYIVYYPILGYHYISWIVPDSVLPGSVLQVRVVARDGNGREYPSQVKFFDISTPPGVCAPSPSPPPEDMKGSLSLSASNIPAEQCNGMPGTFFSLTADYVPGCSFTTISVPGWEAFSLTTSYPNKFGPAGTVLYEICYPVQAVDFYLGLGPNGPWMKIGEKTLMGEPVSGESIYSISFESQGLPQGNYPLKAELIGTEGALFTGTSWLDKKPPLAAIGYPGNGQIVCPSLARNASGNPVLAVSVQGQALDEFPREYILSYSSNTPLSPVFSIADVKDRSVVGELGPWNVSGLDSGVYTIFLQATDMGGFLSCAEAQVFLNAPGQLTSASVTPALFSPNGDGILYYTTLTYSLSNDALLTIRISDLQGKAVRLLLQDFPQVAGSQQVSWDGRDDLGSVLPDGLYLAEIVMKDLCGNIQKTELAVEIDTTPPVAQIISPLQGASVGHMVSVTGIASDLHFAGYSLSVGAGIAPIEWTLIASSDGPVTDSILGLWNTYGLFGYWTVKLTVSDLAGNESSDQVMVFIPSRTDLLSALTADPLLFSPNGDLKLDTANITFTLTTASTITLAILDPSGVSVRTPLDAVQRPVGATTFTWDGRSDNGFSAPNGLFTASLTAVAGSGLTQIVEIPLEVDTTPPQVLPDIPQAGAVFSPPYFVRATITDKNLASYTISVTGTEFTPVILSQGAQSRISEILGVIQGLDDGTYGLTFSAADRAANEALLTIPFTVDTVAPVVTISSPTPMEMVGLARDELPIQAQIVEKNLKGYAVSVGAGLTPSSWTPIASGTALPDSGPLTTWSLAGQSDGTYTILISAIDQLGFTGTAQVPIVLDRTPPFALISSPGPGTIIMGPTDILGTASDENFASYTLDLAAGDPLSAFAWATLISSTSPAVNDALFHWLPALTNGPYTLCLTVTDLAGNTSFALLPLQVILVPPAPPQNLAAIAISSTVLLTWSPVPEPGLSGYNVYRFNIKLTAAPITSPFYVDTGLSDGFYSYTVTTVNIAVQESDPSNTASAIVDTTPPLVVISSPGNGARVHGSLDIVGTAWSFDDFKQYRLYAGPTLLRQSPLPVRKDVLGLYDTIGVPNGTNVTLTLTGEDIHGNAATSQVTVIVDNLPPAPPVLLSAIPSGDTVGLKWTIPADPDFAGVILFRNLQQITAIPFITTSYNDAKLPDGTFTYSAVAVDQAGNWSIPSNSLNAIIETHSPHAVIVSPLNGATLPNSPVVTAQSPDFDISSILFQYQPVTSTTWTNIGPPVSQLPFQIFWDIGVLPYGRYRLWAVATDINGKTDPAPTSITIIWVRPPQGLTARELGDSAVLIWTPDPQAAGFRVYRGGQRLTPTPIIGTMFTDTGLSEGTYSYTVTTMSISGDEGFPQGISVRIYAPIVLEPFHLVTATTALTVDGVHANPGSTVEIFGDGASLGQSSADQQGAFYLDTTLHPGLNTFTAVATDTQGNVSRPSYPAHFTFAFPPATPTGFTGTALGYDVQLSWSPNTESDIMGYILARDGKEFFPILERARSAQASASSSSSPSGNANDGNLGTAWKSSLGGFVPTWLEMAFTYTTLITRVEIDWALGYIGKDYDIQAWDTKAWRVTSRTIDNTLASVSSPVGFATNKIRIQTYAIPTSQTSVGINEVRIYAFTPLTTTSYIDASLKDGHFTYQLTAINLYGLKSGTAALPIPVGDVTPPGPPLNLTSSVSQRDVTLTWTPPTDPDVAGYNVYRDGVFINPPDNLAITGTASASINPWGAQDAIDGDPYSCWYAWLDWWESSKTVWWMVSLQSPLPIGAIDNVSVSWAYGNPPYTLEAWNGSRWVAFATDTVPPFPTDKIRISTTLTPTRLDVCLTEVGILKNKLVLLPPFVDRDLPSSLYTYTVTAVDKGRNESQPSNQTTALVAVSPMTPEFYDPAEGGQTVTVANNLVDIYGYTDRLSFITLYWFSIPIFTTATEDIWGDFSFYAVPLMSGANIFTATANDEFGPASDASLPLTIVFDNKNLPDLLFTDLFAYPPVPISGQKVGLMATVKNGGAGDAYDVPVLFYMKNPSGGLTPIGPMQTIGSLLSGTTVPISVMWDTQGLTGDFTLMAIVDPLFQVPEQREDNNTIEKSVTVAPDTNPVLTASTDHLSYSANETLTAHVMLVNPGSPKDIDLSVTIEDSAGFTVTTLLTQSLPGLPYGERKDFTLPWNTGKTYAGAYSLVARASAQGIQLSEARGDFTILPSYRAASKLTSDKVSYRPHEDVSLTGTITNLSPNTPITGAQAVLTVLDPQGTSLFTQVFGLPELPLGAGQVVKTLWPVDLAPPGLYKAELDVTLSGTLLTSSTKEFSVKGEVLLTGTIQASSRTVGIGATTTVFLLVSNQGNAPVDSLPVYVTLTGPGLVSPVIAFTTSASLPAGSSVTDTFVLSSSGLMTGDYVLYEKALIEGTEKTLTTGSVFVRDLTPPVLAASSPSQGTYLNQALLILAQAADMGLGVAFVSYTIDQGPSIPLPLISGDPFLGTYAETLPLGPADEGDHLLSLVASDLAGNMSPVLGISYTVDITPPLIIITGVEEGALYPESATPVIEVFDAHLKTVEILLNSVSFTSGTTVTEPGTYTLSVSAEDRAGNSPTRSLTFQIGGDRTPPITTITIGSPSYSVPPVLFVSSSTPFTLSATDDLSGVKETQYSIDGAPWQAYTAPFSLSGDGLHTISYRSIDNAGNVEITQTPSVTVDATSPMTAISVGEPQYHDGTTLFVSPLTPISLTAVDAASGVERTEYSIDGSPFSAYTLLLLLPVEGSHTIAYRSRDNLGNVEEAKTLTVTVDQTPPVTTVSVGQPQYHDGAMLYISSMTPITFTATDTLSGVAQIAYSIDAGGWITYTGAITIPSEGLHAVRYRAIDRLGNTDAARSLPVTVDTTPPVTTLIVGMPQYIEGGVLYISSRTSLSLTATDAASGIASTEYSLDGGPWTGYGGPLTFSTEGIHSISYRSTDHVGSIEAAKSQSVTVDVTPPTTQLLVGDPKDTELPTLLVTSNTFFTLTATDSLSGVDAIQYSIDSGPVISYTSPFILPTEGLHIISYTSLDHVGNTEPVHSQAAEVDNTPPLITITGVEDQGKYIDVATPVITVTEAHLKDVITLLNGASYVSGTPITVPGLYALTVTATDLVWNRSTAGVSFSVVPSLPRFSFAGCAFSAVILKNNALVASYTPQTGEIDSKGFVGAHGSLTLDNNAHVEGDVVVGGDLLLRNNALINGDASVYGAVTLQNNARIAGSIVTLSTVPSPCGCFYDLDFLLRAREQDNDNALLRADPVISPYLTGTYLTLSNSVKVTFPSGTFYLDGLHLRNNSGISITASGMVHLYVKGTVLLENNSQINWPAQRPQGVYIVSGGDVAVSENNVKLGAMLYAPRAVVRLRNNVSLYGGLTALSFTAENNSHLVLDESILIGDKTMKLECTP